MLSRSLATALLLALLALPGSAHASRATEAETFSNLGLNSLEEEKAQADQDAFDSEYELEPDDSEPGKPNYYKLLRRSVTKRVGKGKNRKSVSYVPDVNYGVLFTGPSTYHEGENLSIPPASTNKIFTTAFVLANLGGDFTYETKFKWVSAKGEAGYLTIDGSGDPSLSLKNDMPGMVDELVAALKAAGVKKVSGPLTVTSNDSRWDIRTVPYGWKPHDLEITDGFIGGPLGTVPPASLKALLLRKLKAAGIPWGVAEKPSFEVVAGTAGETLHTSQPLRELIKPFVLHSINYKGEAFLRTVGSLKGSRAVGNLHDAGLPLLREFVEKMLGPNGGYSNVTLYDASGLSRKSRVTAKVMVNFLEAVKTESYFADFLASLPISGRTGTLEHRMCRTEAEGHVHAKTGTINGHYQLAGYIEEQTKAGPSYHPFAVLTDTDAAGPGYVRSVVDSVLVKMVGEMLHDH